jgi:hypothetical protein
MLRSDKYPTTVFGWIVIIGVGVYSFVNFLGTIDFVIARSKDPGWLGDVFKLVLYPPMLIIHPLWNVALIAMGLALIYYKHKPKPQDEIAQFERTADKLYQKVSWIKKLFRKTIPHRVAPKDSSPVEPLPQRRPVGLSSPLSGPPDDPENSITLIQPRTVISSGDDSVRFPSAPPDDRDFLVGYRDETKRIDGMKPSQTACPFCGEHAWYLSRSEWVPCGGLDTRQPYTLEMWECKKCGRHQQKTV